ncbi:hypothetical protein ABZ920_23020 [Streptomyces sp. NPDC046831]
MTSDLYAVLRALLRAEAARSHPRQVRQETSPAPESPDRRPPAAEEGERG